MRNRRIAPNRCDHSATSSSTDSQKYANSHIFSHQNPQKTCRYIPLYAVICGAKPDALKPANRCNRRIPWNCIKKRAASKSCSTWRRTWDSNPRGCYTLLAFQASSLATRSILRINARLIIYHKCSEYASFIK